MKYYLTEEGKELSEKAIDALGEPHGSSHDPVPEKVYRQHDQDRLELLLKNPKRKIKRVKKSKGYIRGRG